ncbi:hypothetical protein ACPPVO_10800 [Dactylosporangium sp. McL0621]|uniref:hypothetical protein n=1 Tax=Dactylosporangium sp. McL0621 TaxID=3415678 RepID=UPI003CF80E91
MLVVTAILVVASVALADSFRGSPLANPPPSATKSGQPSASATAPQVRYTGEVTIVTDAKDLDRVPPAKAGKENGGDFEYNAWNGNIFPDGDSSLALWSGKTQPSYFDCTNRAAAASMTSLHLKVGDTVCALTGEGRTVRMKATKHCDGYCAIFETVVWELP